jgi:tetratricopeptide (TPR) repeat protein
MMSDADFWKKRKWIMAHGFCVSRWIKEDGGFDNEKVIGGSIRPGHLHRLGYLLADEDRQRAVQIYQRALQGYEKAWGPEHTSTLYTVNNLGNLYADLGRLDEAEKMLQRTLDGYRKVIRPHNLMTYVPALNNMWAFASLRESQSRVDDARWWYSQALVGYEKTFGLDYNKCESLRNKLALLVRRGEEQNSLTDTRLIADSSKENVLESVTSLTKPASYRYRLLASFQRKQR